MRTAGWVVLAGLLAVGCAHRGGAERSRGFSEASTTAAALSAALEPQRRAVVIGIDSYDDPVFPPLQHARDDAEAVAKVLRDPRGGGFDEVTVLIDADRDAVIHALRELKGTLRREDSLIVYFSGHGTRVPDTERWRRFLLTHDSRSSHLEGSALDLSELQEFFATLPASRKAMIVDACFSGDGKSVVRPDTDKLEIPEGRLVDNRVVVSSGSAMLFATSPGRPSRESDKLGHGVYTYYLLEAMSWGFSDADLDDDGIVTAWEAHDFARGRTVEFTEGVQVPEAALHVLGEGDLVLSGTKDQRRRNERSLLYLYAGADHELHGADVVVDGRARGGLPGTVSVPPGRHRVEVRDGSGEALVDGYVTLSGGRSYSVDDIRRVANGPSRGLSLRPVVLSAPPMSQALGPTAVGLEVWGSRRVNRGPAKGVSASWAGGVLSRPSNAAGNGRALFFATGDAGFQSDIRRLRYRASWGISAILAPPSWPDGRPERVADLRDHPQNAGWLVAAMGPGVGVGYVLSETISLTATGRAHASVLDIDADGRATVVPWLTAGVGPEVSW